MMNFPPKKNVFSLILLTTQNSKTLKLFSLEKVKIDSLRTIKITLFFIFLSATLSGQDNEELIFNSYNKFNQAPREIAYLHLNKSSFIKEEFIGFSAYILNKSTKKTLVETSNLYCSILDEENKVIKSKLVLVKKGFAHNIFKVDSLFKPGVYKFRAYTNWMRNFNERNYYEHSFSVLNTEEEEKVNVVNNNYNIQVLPESGHLVNNLSNNLGIIVKDNLGFGLKNASGKLVDNLENLVTSFTLNKFGIAKIPLFPEKGKSYKILVNNKDKILSKRITDIDFQGFVFSVKPLRGKVGLHFKTNKSTLQNIKNKSYLLAIHNGDKIKTVKFQFSNKTEFYKIFENETLYSGINIFTVFDLETKKPILERLYFNYNHIPRISTQDIIAAQETDSVSVKLKFSRKQDSINIQNISISILPKLTKAYSINSNILSQTYLEPYVKGFVEDAAYYFNKPNLKTTYNLDNLLITQGWSSYNWYNVFKEKKYPYKFEKGIEITANINNDGFVNYLALPLKNSKTKIFTTTDADKTFTHSNLYPEDKEKYKISLLNSKSTAAKPKLYLQFKPAVMPSLQQLNYQIPFKKPDFKKEKIDATLLYSNFNATEELDEVVIKANLEKKRREKLSNTSASSRIEFFDDKLSDRFPTIELYLRTKGFNVSQSSNLGTFTITNQRVSSPEAGPPIVILDGVRLTDIDILRFFRMDIVDYVEIDQIGLQYGRTASGVINIVTDPVRRASENSTTKNNVSTYNFPLSFSTPKKYYTPNYVSYTTTFFKEYGAITWYPNLKIDTNGFVTFKFPNKYKGLVNLYIEGVVNNNFVSEIKTLNVK
ncbi:hypothetical protein [uncultured Polaribacter sp.]|uniref:hypothetical protein n=1 Tax=uncultured Polaribacter sp. TaxID=174711 RepID=UPI0026196000|nr:hypothetical protein [uncultured Polaribacter sp.]